MNDFEINPSGTNEKDDLDVVTLENDPEFTFEQYVQRLELSQDDLKKKILDVGSAESYFAKYLNENNISKDVFGVDLWNRFIYKKMSVQGRGEDLPFKKESFELVIALCSVPLMYWWKNKNADNVDMKKKIKNNLSEMIRVTKAGGEIKFGPIPLEGRTDKVQYFSDVFREILNEVKEENLNLEVNFFGEEEEKDNPYYKITTMISIKKPQHQPHLG